MQQLSGEWVTVGTGCKLARISEEEWAGFARRSFTASGWRYAADCVSMFAEGKTVAVEHAEPVYLRNNVAWKKLPGKNES